MAVDTVRPHFVRGGLAVEHAELSLSTVIEMDRPTTDAPVLVLGQTKRYVDAAPAGALDDEGAASI